MTAADAAASMDSHVGLDYIVDNPDYCVKLASGKSYDAYSSLPLPSPARPPPGVYARINVNNATRNCSVGRGMPVGEEASGGVTVGAVRLQSGRQAEGHRYPPQVSGEISLLNRR